MELSIFTEQVQKLPALYKSKVEIGDYILVKTQNSIYKLRALKGNEYHVSGGRFDRKKQSPIQITITGCGQGSAFVKIDLIAACGLRIEFGNKVITSSISSYVFFKSFHLN